MEIFNRHPEMLTKLVRKQSLLPLMLTLETSNDQVVNSVLQLMVQMIRYVGLEFFIVAFILIHFEIEQREYSVSFVRDGLDSCYNELGIPYTPDASANSSRYSHSKVCQFVS